VGEETPSNQNQVSIVGLLTGWDINPQVFGHVGTRLWFHFMIPTTLAAIRDLSSS
jgi:hypothetical protein